MYKKSWFRNRVVSSDGYSVEILSFSKLIYKENADNIICFIEPLSGKSGAGDLLLDASSIEREGSMDPIVEPRKSLIILRIIGALNFIKIKVDVIKR